MLRYQVTAVLLLYPSLRKNPTNAQAPNVLSVVFVFIANAFILLSTLVDRNILYKHRWCGQGKIGYQKSPVYLWMRPKNLKKYQHFVFKDKIDLKKHRGDTLIRLL